MMSELTLFSKGGNTLPAHLRNIELDETTKALMGGSGATGKRISIRGGVFRMIVDGKEVAQNEDRSMNIVIVAANANVSRSFYAGDYEENKNISPDCWSNDGISPDVKVSEPQASKCASCPQNIAGSAKQGGGRACRFSQRMAVMLENDLHGDVYQLTLPAQSIFGNVENGKMPMQAYAKFLGGHSLPITAVVTEMRFDTASATPKLTFKAVRPLEADELANCQEKGRSPEAKAAISQTPAALDGAKPKAVAAPVASTDDGDEDEAPAPAPVKVKAEEVPAEEPTKRPKKAAPKDVSAILDDWAE
jgi:hypothetical protein